jgi:hypothetical protein
VKRALVLAALLLGTAPAARAVDLGDSGVSLEVTEALTFDYHARLLETYPHVADFRNKLNLRLRYQGLTIGGRVDAAWFPNPPAASYQDDLRPEEMFVSYRGKGWSLTAGDDYLSFGRGLALSLKKLDEVGFDVKLRGLHAALTLPYLSARVGAGLANVTNVDGVDEKRVPDPNDAIFAARVEGRPVPWLKLGGHFVDVERTHSPVPLAFAPVIWGYNGRSIGGQRFVRSLVFGGNLELVDLAGVLSAYLEADYLMNTNQRLGPAGYDAVLSDGFGIYGSVTAVLGPLVLLGEVKHYDDFQMESSAHPETASLQGIAQQFPYITPPSLERNDQRVVENANVTGFHLRGDYRLPDDDDLAFLSLAYIDGAPAHGQYTIHAYGGYEHKWSQNRLVVQTGARFEENPALGATTLHMGHLDVDLYYLLGGPHDLQFHFNHELRSEDPGQSNAEFYLEGTTYLTYTYGAKWSFSLQFEYRTDPITDLPYYPGVGIKWKFLDSSYVQVFAGRGKGGLKCSGGVCRVFPEFEGVKLETVVRF